MLRSSSIMRSGYEGRWTTISRGRLSLLVPPNCWKRSTHRGSLLLPITPPSSSFPVMRTPMRAISSTARIEWPQRPVRRAFLFSSPPEVSSLMASLHRQHSTTSTNSSSASSFPKAGGPSYKSLHQPPPSSAKSARTPSPVSDLAGQLRGSSCSEDTGPLPPRPLTPLQKRQLQMKNKATFTLTPPALRRVRYLISLFQPDAAPSTTTPSSSGTTSSSPSPRASHRSGEKEVEEEKQEGGRIPSGIRIGVRRRGCSGYSYTVNYYFEPTKTANDTSSTISPSNSTTHAAAAAARSSSSSSPSKKEARVWNPFEEDTVVEQDGLKVVVAADALFYVIGTVMDYIVTNVEEKFVFRNPNKKYSCGCEESFMPYDSEDLEDD